ncbi:MAG: alpha/beta fold hydrolase [Candidatus Kerfeldbacteria bacterium]|nr:alpha/beta fold hydrolase [Candidatus Kerfeldbacteria bacterium]
MVVEIHIKPSQWLPVLAVLGLLVGGWYAITYDVQHSSIVTPTESLVNPDTLAKRNALPASVSIPALMQREYTGTDFILGPTLEKGVGYNRYFMSYNSDGLTITGSIAVPTSEGSFPLVVLNHALVDREAYRTGDVLIAEQRYLAQHGYVALVPDYRNHAGSDDDPNVDRDLRFGYVIDVINALQAVERAQLEFVDTERVGMIGYSMGAVVALGVAVAQPDLLDAIVLYSPISADMWVNYQRWMADLPIANEIIKLYGTIESNENFWEEASPAHYLDKILAPILIHHGTADTYVPISFSEELVIALKAANSIPVVFNKYLDQGHEFNSAHDEALDRTVKFLDEYLK